MAYNENPYSEKFLKYSKKNSMAPPKEKKSVRYTSNS